jgi:hypothetical protein
LVFGLGAFLSLLCLGLDVTGAGNHRRPVLKNLQASDDEAKRIVARLVLAHVIKLFGFGGAVALCIDGFEFISQDLREQRSILLSIRLGPQDFF